LLKKGRPFLPWQNNFNHTSNPTLIAFILDFNPEVTNADFITVGQKIKVPKLTEESLIMIADHAHRIHVGTFLTHDSAGLYRNEPALKGKKIDIVPRKVSPKDTWYTI